MKLLMCLFPTHLKQFEIWNNNEDIIGLVRGESKQSFIFEFIKLEDKFIIILTTFAAKVAKLSPVRPRVFKVQSFVKSVGSSYLIILSLVPFYRHLAVTNDFRFSYTVVQRRKLGSFKDSNLGMMRQGGVVTFLIKSADETDDFSLNFKLRRVDGLHISICRHENDSAILTNKTF